MSSQRLLSGASVELMTWLSVCRLFVLYGQAATDNRSGPPPLDTGNACVFSLETYLGNICEHASPVLHFFRCSDERDEPQVLCWLQNLMWADNDAWTKLVIYYAGNWSLGTALIKAWETHPHCPPASRWQPKANARSSEWGTMWNWGQLWNATSAPQPPCRRMCTAHT